MKRKLISLLLIISLMLSLAGCGEEAAEEEDAQTGFPTHSQEFWDAKAEENLQNRPSSQDPVPENSQSAAQDYIPGLAGSYPINLSRHFYYRDLLSPLEQNFYDAIVDVAYNPYRADNFSTFFWDEQLRVDVYLDAFHRASLAVSNDHPELFFLGLHADSRLLGPGVRELGRQGPSYGYSVTLPQGGPELEQLISNFNAAVEQQYLFRLTEFGSHGETARQIHDLMLQNITYDYQAEAGKIESALSHCAYGALVANSAGTQRTAVCEGYAKLFLYLNQMTGADCMLITGPVAPPDPNSGHAWNLLKVDGRWREVDVTWDDGEYEQNPHRFFCISTEEMHRIGGRDGVCRRRCQPGEADYLGELPIAP